MAYNLDKCKEAAIAYVGLGVAIVLMTVLFIPEAHYRSGFIPLLGGIIVLLVLAAFIYRGIRWLIIILAVFATGRTAWFIYSYFVFSDEQTRWVYLINAVLNCGVVLMLARAAADKSPKSNKSPD